MKKGTGMALLKPGDPCPCCGEPILTNDPEKLLLLSWIGRQLEKDRKNRPGSGAAVQS